MSTFTKELVLSQINATPGRLNRSAYINMGVYQALMKAGERRAFPFIASRTRRMLNALVKDGVVERLDNNGDGLGYEWKLTGK